MTVNSIEINYSRVVHHVLIVLPELESQLTGQLLDCGALADQEVPVVARKPSDPPVLASGERIVRLRVISHDHKGRICAGGIEIALQYPEALYRQRTDAMAGGMSHCQHNDVALKAAQIEAVSAVTPTGWQRIQTDTGGRCRC